MSRWERHLLDSCGRLLPAHKTWLFRQMVGHCGFSHGEALSINNRCPLPLLSLQLIIIRNLDQSVRCMLVHTTCTVLFVMSVDLVGQEQHDQFKALLSNPAPLHLLRQCYLSELSPTLFSEQFLFWQPPPPRQKFSPKNVVAQNIHHYLGITRCDPYCGNNRACGHAHRPA